jgi:hypothetical protein
MQRRISNQNWGRIRREAAVGCSEDERPFPIWPTLTVPAGFHLKPLEAVTVVEWLPETLDSDEHSREEQLSLRVCETCAERGRPNEPVYKMGMCEFCYKGLPHPKATRKQLITETGGQRPPSKSSLG